jgi:putative ABC transport system substrate-binding protein
MTILPIAIAVLLPASPLAEAQQTEKVYRIGLLGLSSRSDVPGLAALRQGLRDLGYEEGKNLVIEYRWAEGRYDRLPALADELVRLKVDVLITYATPGARAAKQATTTIPVVVASMGRVSSPLYAEAGLLMSYGPDVHGMAKQAATHVDRILKGARPEDLPVQRPARLELVVNLKTARAIGVTIPPSLTLRADRVVE